MGRCPDDSKSPGLNAWESDSVGQFFPAVPASFAIGVGESTQLLGVTQTTPVDDSVYRYNYGFVETTGGNVTVTVTARDQNALVLATDTVYLGPFEPRQWNLASRLLPLTDVRNVRLEVEVTGGNAWAVYGKSTTGYAGRFDGDVSILGTLSKSGGSFKIDHPLDPEGMYLSHSFVESPDMMNIYNGNVRTDADGYAVVELPDYFEALNRDFRYQLTVIGPCSHLPTLENPQLSDSAG